MNKYEFITALQRNLTGKVSVQKLNELTDYYNDYIDTEIRKGKSEDEVLASLGDPRLLAKSIADAEGTEGTEQTEFYDGNDFDRRESAYQGAYGDADTRFVVNGKVVPKWKAKLFGILALVVFLLILFVILKILGFALGIIFRFVLPVLIPLAIIWFVISVLSGK